MVCNAKPRANNDAGDCQTIKHAPGTTLAMLTLYLSAMNSSAMPPMEAIVANTSRNAWLMGLEGEVGVIAPGKLADIVIWNSDPLADITVLQRPSEISTIIKDGRVVDREAGGFRQLPNELLRARASISG